MPATATYATLELSHRCCDLALARTPFRRARQPILAVVFFLIVLALWQSMPTMLAAITSSPEPFTVWPLVFHDINLYYGAPATTGCFLALIVVSLLPVMVLPTSPLDIRHRFVMLPVVGLNASFFNTAPQFRALFRSRYTLQAALLSAGFVALLATRVAGPSSAWGVEPLTIGRFFQYATLAPSFRIFEPRLPASRW